MKKKKKIRLSVLVTAGFTISLLLLTISYSLITASSIRNIGNFAVRIDEENLQNISSNLFLEITRRTAREYAAYFNDAEEITRILGKQIAERTLSEKIVNDIEPDEELIKLYNYKNRGFFVSEPKNAATAFYWGQTERNNVPKIVIKQINSLNMLTPMIEGFMRYSMDYFSAIWVHGKDDYMFMYPKSDKYYKNLKSSKAFYEYFNVFDIIRDNQKKPDVIRPIWLKPYKDVTGVTVSSVFTPIYDKNDDILAVVGLDMNLGKLLDSMLASRLLVDSKTENSEQNLLLEKNLFHGFLFITNTNSSIMAFPEEYVDLFSLPANYSDLKNRAEFIQTKLIDSKSPVVKDLVKKITRSHSGVELVKLKGEKYFIAYSRLDGTSFILGFVVSEDQLLSSAKETRCEMNRIEFRAIIHGLLISLGVLVVSIIIALLFFKKYLFTRIETFRRKVRKMGEGKFNIQFKEEGILEISELGSTFNYLGKELRAYTKNLKAEIIAREQIETEVKIAADLQLSLLPKVDKSFQRDEFSMAAKLSPAKEASGDYFDFFYLNENKIVLIIADVVGKGISAAFYMGMVKTLLKNICYQEDEDPSKALNRVNRILSQDNSTLMFVTLFLGYYDTVTGKMLYANAGHHDAICISKDGIYRTFGITKGIAIGVTDQRKYRSGKSIINKGDTVVLYTDGVIEAVSPKREDFGEARFKELLLKNKSMSSNDLADKIINDVRKFENQKRYDDVTVIVFRREK
jgi:hypothetical protein